MITTCHSSRPHRRSQASIWNTGQSLGCGATAEHQLAAGNCATAGQSAWLRAVAQAVDRNIWGQPSVDQRQVKYSRCLRPAVSNSLRKCPVSRTDTDRSVMSSSFRSGFHRFRTTDNRAEPFSEVYDTINPEFRRDPRSLKQPKARVGLFTEGQRNARLSFFYHTGSSDNSGCESRHSASRLTFGRRSSDS